MNFCDNTLPCISIHAISIQGHPTPGHNGPFRGIYSEGLNNRSEIFRFRGNKVRVSLAKT